MSRNKDTVQHTPAPGNAHQDNPVSLPAIIARPRTGVGNSKGSAEAANLTRLGNCIFTYAFLAAVADVGVLAISTTLGMPLEGAFGSMAIARILLLLMAALALMLVAYTYLCSSDFTGNGWRRPALQFLGVALVFMFLGLDRGDMTLDTLQLLKWVAAHAGHTDLGSLAGATIA